MKPGLGWWASLSAEMKFSLRFIATVLASLGLAWVLSSCALGEADARQRGIGAGQFSTGRCVAVTDTEYTRIAPSVCIRTAETLPDTLAIATTCTTVNLATWVLQAGSSQRVVFTARPQLLSGTAVGALSVGVVFYADSGCTDQLPMSIPASSQWGAYSPITTAGELISNHTVSFEVATFGAGTIYATKSQSVPAGGSTVMLLTGIQMFYD